jgi:hypothetical protein
MHVATGAQAAGVAQLKGNPTLDSHISEVACCGLVEHAAIYNVFAFLEGRLGVAIAFVGVLGALYRPDPATPRILSRPY